MEKELLNQLDNEGIIKFKGFLNSAETNEVKNILSFYSVPKGHHKSYYSVKFHQFILKLIKFDFKKLKHDLIIFNLAKKKKPKHSS